MVDSRKRILLVDDHEVVGEGLKALLSHHYEILGPIRDGSLVIAAVAKHQPDALVLDISLPGRNGLDLLPELVRSFGFSSSAVRFEIPKSRIFATTPCVPSTRKMLSGFMSR